jgi:hypothetical protein
MAGMGPAPKPAGTRARRNPTVAMTKLPSEGRGRKRAPNWPLPSDIGRQVRQQLAEESALDLEQQLTECEDGRTRRRLERQLVLAKSTARVLAEEIKREERLERELWRDLWRTPQADIWEKLAWDREVAQYARWKVRGELGDLDAAKEARQWSDRLGLNPLAMLRLRWEIERTEDAETRGARRRAAPGQPAPRPAGGDPRAILHAVQ